MSELDIAVLLVMLPQRPEHESGFVLLDRHLCSLVRRVPRRVPARGDRAVRVVFLQKVPVAVRDTRAEVEELSRQMRITRKIESIRHERPVTRPKVAVMVGRTL